MGEIAMRKIIIDSDTGSDDAVAIAMVIKQKNIEVLGITTVSGNCSLEQATKNALMTVQVCDENVGVYKGCALPIMREQKIDAINVHGKDGMGDSNLINPIRKHEEEHAVDFMLNTIKKYPEEVEILVIGPATNIAVAIMKDPITMNKVKHFYIMGSAGLGRGNASSVAEFNTYADAESLDVLLRKNRSPKTIIGFDVCIKNALNKEEINLIKNKNKLGEFLINCNKNLIDYNIRREGKAILDLPDAVAAAVMLWSNEIASEIKNVYVKCCYKETETYGQVIINDRTDLLAVANHYPNNNATLVLSIDEAKFKEKLFQVI